MGCGSSNVDEASRKRADDIISKRSKVYKYEKAVAKYSEYKKPEKNELVLFVKKGCPLC